MEPVTYATTKDGRPAEALPLGRTAAYDRYMADARERGFRPELCSTDDDALGVDEYLRMAYDFGLMDERPRPSLKEVLLETGMFRLP